MNATQRIDLLERTFARHFSCSPSTFCRAPGRVDLMGSHTDYNLGRVLTLPIHQDTWIAARPNGLHAVRAASANLDSAATFAFDSNEKNPEAPWIDYIHGVAIEIAKAGLPLTGFDAVVHSTLPMGSGLSSSAALECAAATTFESLGGWSLAPVEKALLCQRAENQFVGVNCGILDQYTSCLGREGCALLLDCRDLTSRPVAIPTDIRIVICNTRSKRELAGSEYGERRAQCEEGTRRLGIASLREIAPAEYEAREHELPAAIAKRCRFIVAENARVQSIANALSENHRAAIGQLTAASYQGARDLYEIISPPMEAMINAMRSAPGFIGGRQAGAGFGGCMVAFVNAHDAPTFAHHVHQHYRNATGIEPDILHARAAQGAGKVTLPECPVPS